ncbi:HicB family protein [Dehalogenimonas lykanthroporepellens BL-DC-9]|nr:HicB family protein [Dehalogenimonas lykanthroporepellens BL-DC-9]
MDKYTYRVTWSDEDEEYVGLCAEFPSLSWLAESQGEALVGIRNTVSQVIQDLAANGESVPEPLASKNCSGKLQVRITPELHKALQIQAAESRVSLNRLISDKLARC